jgi:glucose/arabinose dehydrogenase
MRHALIILSASSALSALLACSGEAVGQSIADLWNRNCISCHAEDGRGGGAGTPSLLDEQHRHWLRTSESDRAFFGAIKSGHEGTAMPGFGEAFKDKQIYGLVVHIRELQERARKREVKAPRPDAKGVVTTQHAAYRVATVIDSGVDVPWGIGFVPAKTAWAPEGGVLVATRPGPIVLARPGQKPATIQNTPRVFANAQGGMMDIVLHPAFADNGWIYITYSEPGPERNRGLTVLARGRIAQQGDTLTWTDQQVLWKARPEHYITGGLHFGSRIAFDPAGPVADGPDKGKIRTFFCMGERGRGELAQDLARPNGKIFRINDDGSIPADNPFVGPEHEAKGVYSAIWSYGHRNPQGLVFDTQGNLWATEHGPRGGDELNLVQKGRNYGWPLVAFSINYAGTSYRTPWPDIESVEDKNIVQPTMVWTPSIAVCGLAVVTGTPFESWSGDLLAGGLAGQVVERLRIRDGKVVEREEIIRGQGRVRDVKVGPDGLVYVAFNDPDKVVRLEPAGGSPGAAR